MMLSSFETYQKQYFIFMKAIIKTRLLGILSQEIFEGYPDNLPEKYQKQMFDETLFLKGKAPKPDYFSPYTKHSIQLQHLENFNINFIHKIGKDSSFKIKETNPPIKEIYSSSFLGEYSLNPEMYFNDFVEFMNSDAELVQRMKAKEEKKERLQKAWLFNQWFFYQEVIVIMSLLESFLIESYDIYIHTYPEIKDGFKRNSDSDEICFRKLLSYFMNKDLKLVQRFGSKNERKLLDFWIRRCAIVHNNGVINEKSLKNDKDTILKDGDEVLIDCEMLDELYFIIGNFQRIIYKKIRLHNMKSNEKEK